MKRIHPELLFVIVFIVSIGIATFFTSGWNLLWIGAGTSFAVVTLYEYLRTH